MRVLARITEKENDDYFCSALLYSVILKWDNLVFFFFFFFPSILWREEESGNVMLKDVGAAETFHLLGSALCCVNLIKSLF